MPRRLKHVRPGDAVTADGHNLVVDAVNLLLETSGSFPVEVRRNAAGIQIGLARPLGLRKGKLDAALPYRSASGAVVSLYGGVPGSEIVSGEKITAYDWHLLSGESLAAGTTVTVARIDSHWYVIAAACEAEASASAAALTSYAASVAAMLPPPWFPFGA